MSTDEQRINVLRRNTAFACNLRFRCDLPEPPSDPKLLISPLQPEKLASFAITSLERNPRRELVMEPELGIHIGLMDTSEYSVTDSSARIAPEDLALLEGETEFAPNNAPNTKSHKLVRERLRGSKAELSWLMRTSYISNDTESKRQAVQNRAREVENAEENKDADDAHLKEVEASFEAATREPVHPTDPRLTPVEVTPVLPDFDRWGNNYVLIDFEGDPTADHPRLSKLSMSQRQQLAGEAVVKSYALPGGGKPFLAYMVPKTPSADVVDNDLSREAHEGEFEWVREYQYDVTNTRDLGSNSTYLLRLEDGKATYLDLNTRMKCTKRTRGSHGVDLRSEFPRPSKITVRSREESEQEAEASKKRQQDLRGVTDDP